MNHCSRFSKRLVAILSLALLPLYGYGAVITYTSSLVGSNHWIYEYRVAAAAGDPAIAEFTIYFDPARYANLAVDASPPGWDSLAIQPDPAIPADGFFDALVSGPGIAPGEAVGGFRVAFDFFATGTPGSQRFDIVDPATLATLATGFTVIEPASAVPEPASGALLFLGLALAFGRLRRHR